MGRSLRALRAGVLVFHAVKTISLLANAQVFPRLRAAGAAAATSATSATASSAMTTSAEATSATTGAELTRSVSLLVPVRDEAANIVRTMPTWLRQSVDEILLLDDGSTDGTADVARRIADNDPRVRILDGATLPDGWHGKPWACHQLAAAATGELLVFCDADVELHPGAVEAIVAAARAQHADVFSVFPRQLTVGLGERMLVPLIDDVLLAFLPFGLLSMPIPAAASANGQLLAFQREAYDAIGGHEAARDAVVEDVRLAFTARSAGLRLGLALGNELVQTRMYDGYRATVRGFGKSVRAAHGGSRLLMALTALAHLVTYTLPWVLARRDSGWALAATAGSVQRVIVNATTGRGAPWEALLVPVTPLAALPVYAVAMRRNATWKGRSIG